MKKDERGQEGEGDLRFLSHIIFQGLLGRDFVLLLGQLISSLLGIIIMLYAKSDQSKPIFHSSVILFPTLIKACLP